MKGMKFVGQVARMGEIKNVYRIVVVEVKMLLFRSVCRLGGGGGGIIQISVLKKQVSRF
jgi:hypothetical protein